jgi:hypothetical protein
MEGYTDARFGAVTSVRRPALCLRIWGWRTVNSVDQECIMHFIIPGSLVQIRITLSEGRRDGHKQRRSERQLIRSPCMHLMVTYYKFFCIELPGNSTMSLRRPSLTSSPQRSFPHQSKHSTSLLTTAQEPSQPCPYSSRKTHRYHPAGYRNS